MRTSVLLCLTFWACSGSGQKVLDHRFENEVWRDGDTLWAPISIDQSGKAYDIALEVGLASSYPWQNLYLMTIWEQPDGFRQASRINLVFQNEAGEWYARDGRFQTFIGRSMRLGSTGLYRLGLLPYVRADSVPGIRFLRIRVYEKE